MLSCQAAISMALLVDACVPDGPTFRRASPEQRLQIETNKVDGTDNVYIFRNGNHQSMPLAS
jgi:hypothetical protein